MGLRTCDSSSNDDNKSCERLSATDNTINVDDGCSDGLEVQSKEAFEWGCKKLSALDNSNDVHDNYDHELGVQRKKAHERWIEIK